MLKFRLLLTTAPFMAAMLALVFVRQEVLRLPGLVEFGDIGPILTGAALVIGFMLAGIVADYKESERLPGELAASLEAIEDVLVEFAGAGKPLDLGHARQQHYAVVSAVTEWLLNRTGLDECLAAFGTLHGLVSAVERAGGMNAHVSRGLAEMHNIRRTVLRIDTIRRTKFIQSGYVLLDVLVGTVLLLLLVATFKSAVAQTLVTGFLTLLYVYLVRLIRDLDNPFDYAADGLRTGLAEVDPAPVLHYRQRLAGRLGGSIWIADRTEVAEGAEG